MLVLSRKIGESITLPDHDIVITILDTGNKVRLGVTAPRDCMILRTELCQPTENPARTDQELSLA